MALGMKFHLIHFQRCYIAALHLSAQRSKEFISHFQLEDKDLNS